MRFGSRLAVNLDFLGENIDSLKKLCPQNNIIFMVKANGYGHGIVEVVRYALKKGINEFGCATLAEAVNLREQIPDQQFEIYVFSDFNLNIEAEGDLFLEKRIIPVITNEHDLKIVLSNQKYRFFPLCLKFNTGMNRLGMSWDKSGEIADLIKSNGRDSVFHVMTHMACASQSHREHPLNIKQRERFDEVKQSLKSRGLTIESTSIANSGTIEQGFGLEETHIRPGLMLYGPSSLDESIRHLSKWNGKIISALETEIIKVRSIKKGEPVGYGGTTATKDGQLAIITLGYGDGLSTNYGNSEMFFKEYTGNIFGRVNMDMAQILFPADADIKEKSTIQIWNEDPSRFLKLSKQTQMIPYELFCQISSRVPRVYLESRDS
jgi:alanine racemase